MGDPVVRFQILSKVPDETARFYSDLFGWKIDANNPLGYRRISTGSADGIQGGIWPAPSQSPVFVQIYMAVKDLKSCMERAQSLGANVIVPPTALPEGGELAILHDPQGMSFGIVTAESLTA
jgi:predicted enzyme related to lactoylglutathione lyase